MAVLETGGKVTVVKSLRAVPLPVPLAGTDGPGAGKEDENPDAIFGLEAAPATAATEPEDEWDMTADGVGDDFRQDTNEALLANLFEAEHAKYVTVGLAIPAGQTLIQTFPDADYRKRKRKELEALVREKIQAVYSTELSADQYGHAIQGDGGLLIGSLEGVNQLLNMVDGALEFYKGKVTLREIAPVETLLTGLVLAHQPIGPEEYSVILHIEEHQSRIVLLKGHQILQVMPVIAEGATSKRVIRTLFSKLLFELDRGVLPTVDHIVFTGSDLKGAGITFMQEQFIDVKIGRLELDTTRVLVAEDAGGQVEDFLPAIAAAWAASGKDAALFPKLSLIPKYVAIRQAVFRLEWHGYLVLALIALTPILVNQVYRDRMESIDSLKSEVAALNSQIAQNRGIASIVDALALEQAGMTRRLELMDSLAAGTYRWSHTFALLNREVSGMRGVWIHNLQADENTLILQGFATSRDRVSRLSNIFADAVIQQVLEKEERERPLYEFTLLVTRVTDNPLSISPPRVEPPETLFQPMELNSSGTIRN